MKKIYYIFLPCLILTLSGCVSSKGSSNLQAVRIDKREAPIGLSKQEPVDLLNKLKELDTTKEAKK